MKKLACVLIFLVICCTTSVIAEIDLTSMSFDELVELKTSLEEEMITRNVKMLDLKSLSVDELEELILQSLYELCDRQEFVDGLGSVMNKAFESMFGYGVQLVFKNENGSWYNVSLADQNIELTLKTKTEQIAEELSNIQIAP